MNKRRNKKTLALIVLGLFLVTCISLSLKMPVKAAAELDYIHNYEITVEVNEDASLNLTYHIDWEVLDSKTEGPLSWVNIGVPNKHVISVKPLSSNISRCDIKKTGQPNIEIHFDRDYYKGEIVSFDFLVVQDNMYEIDKSFNDFTDYVFTPGWFDNIKVGNLVIKWPVDKTDMWMPSCEMDGDYLVWRTSLGKGERFSVSVTYPNDAYDFNITKSNEAGNSNSGSGSKSGSSIDTAEEIFRLLFTILMVPFSFAPFIIPIIVTSIGRKRYQSAANMGTGNGKKVTRTLITYYPSCRGCGATRKPDEQNCSYCGRSFIEKEETITEEKCPEDKKDILKFSDAGEFQYSSLPNTFVRVNVVNVPVHHSSGSSSRGSSFWSSLSSGSSGSSSHHSSCAHSHCACACACACAGGGRAGCSQKDFYNTNLKLKTLNTRE